MANLEGGRFNKFTVIKNDDLYKYIKVSDLFVLKRIMEKIQHFRKKAGKKDNIYIVINTDEPYADEVIEIMKKNGHWG